MKTEKKQNHIRIIGTTIIWATVIMVTALTLRGTTYLTQLLPILGGGAASSLMTLVSIPDKNNP